MSQFPCLSPQLPGVSHSFQVRPHSCSRQLPGCSSPLTELNPRFQITAAPTFGALPTAHTCFNQLCLPDYDGYEQLVHALLWAINEGGEGFGMI
ncbi:hypothetical protein MSG28_006592 [Choristoneura fumiferana]|uniref:Uncharacterized protein n=1 Tax=Choristoneura fumiferana TaxID=7141 RepID=A0ACC0JFL8_CHOFU|nr:hypothetical protein MSG28_006592 [Choristoneura fumiferana]